MDEYGRRSIDERELVHEVPAEAIDVPWRRSDRDGDDEGTRQWRERRLAVFLGVATSIVLVVWMLWSMTADRRAIANLPAHQRRVIFEHTLTSLRAMCLEPEDPVIRHRCRDQAEFLLSFPECQAECQAIVAPLLRRATR